MRQTWYEAVRKHMSDGARLAFYEACFDYEFYGRKPGDTSDELFPHDDAMLMFDVVLSDLQRDMEKAETIAMRNRRNGMLGGRPRKTPENNQVDLSDSTNPKETQKNPDNPDGFFGFTTTLHNTLHIQSTDKSVSLAKRKKRHTDIDRYERFGVMFVFFYSGAIDPGAECERFYNYYLARDWQVGRGQKIKDKVALAKTWDIKDDDAGLIKARKVYADMITALDPDEPELLTDFVAMLINQEKKTVTIRMRNGNRLSSILEHSYIAPMSAFIRSRFEDPEGVQLYYEFAE